MLRNGRFEIRHATMLDLIKTAYKVDPDTVFGGPEWLDRDHFDVIATAPPSVPPETVKLMLQSLLAERFRLAAHNDTKPVQGFVLSAGKGKHKLKTASGSAEAGCQVQPPSPPGNGVVPMNVVSCRSMGMEEFAPWLRTFANGYLTSPVLDATGLKGSWDFDLRWTSKGMLPLAGADGVSLFDAIDRQLGLKLEPGKVPMPVLVVDSVNEKPTPNLPDVKTALPPPPTAEFEVASVRPSAPGARLGMGQLQPGGRYEAHGYPMFLMIRQAWESYTMPGEEIPGTPKWLTVYSPLVDIIAKVPDSVVAGGGQIYDDDLRTMMRSLLTDRFQMKVHYEDRPMDTYTLVAVKPKMKRADPSNRGTCRTGPSQEPRDIADGPPPFVATCQNITMAQFAARLQAIAPTYFRYAIDDGTGLDGAWDFSLSFLPVDPNRAGGGGGRSGGPAQPLTAGVIDPTGGVSIFDAVEKQLGLKLEVRKRPEPVLVIDHIEEKPIDN